MKTRKEIFKDWECVAIFEPEDTDAETYNEFSKYLKNKRSSVGDKYVPNAERTRMILSKY